MLTVGAGGAPGLTLLDTDGTTVRAALVVGPDGAPGFALFHGEERAASGKAGQHTAKSSWKRNATQHIRKIRPIPETKS